mgnify:CR=1 FL=1
MKKVLIVLLGFSFSSAACTMSSLGYSKGAINAVMETINNQDSIIKSVKSEDLGSIYSVELVSSGNCVKQYFEVNFLANCQFSVSPSRHTDSCDKL